MYLLPEGTIPKKGANTTTSILHYALETGYRGKEEIDICCDNCGGQTYNNIVVKYILWRTMTGRQKRMMVIENIFLDLITFMKIKGIQLSKYMVFGNAAYNNFKKDLKD